ncbi:MAG: hypothetical protein LC623_06460 [Halobacteriales archaeon]|nr:hypothetical protein [Halobacteriales archaeon]
MTPAPGRRALLVPLGSGTVLLLLTAGWALEAGFTVECPPRSDCFSSGMATLFLVVAGVAVGFVGLVGALAFALAWSLPGTRRTRLLTAAAWAALALAFLAVLALLHGSDKTWFGAATRSALGALGLGTDSLDGLLHVAVALLLLLGTQVWAIVHAVADRVRSRPRAPGA